MRPCRIPAPRSRDREAGLERGFERFLFACRRRLAPFYAALTIALVVLLVRLPLELGHVNTHAFESTESQTILGVRALVDLTFTGSPAIRLLKSFLDVKNYSDRDLSWLVGIHMVFVVSGLLMAPTDRLSAGHHEK